MSNKNSINTDSNCNLNNDVLKEILSYNYKCSYCVLGDCYKECCHHCFPIKGCNKHEICKVEGQFEPMVEVILKKINN